MDRRAYDLVLIAHDVADPQAQAAVVAVNKLSKKSPVLFLPEDPPGAVPALLAEGSQANSDGECSDLWLQRTMRSAALFAREEQIRREAEETLRTLYRAIEQAADLVVITDNSGTIEIRKPGF